VVIGVADYQHIDDLDYTDDDAQDMYNTLINNCGFQPSDINLLIDSAATKSSIQNAITNWLASREGPGDLVVIFFSGHSGSGPDVPPLDEADGHDEYLSPYDALTDSWANDIADDELDAWLSTLDSTKVVVIIDSCFSGGMIKGAKGSAKAGSGKVAVGDGFAKDIDRAGRVVMTACDDDQESFEFDALQNGIFTYYLVEGLQAAAADVNGNGSVSVEEAYSYLRDRVDNYVLTHVPYPDNNDGEGQDAQLYDGVPGEVDLSRPSAGPTPTPTVTPPGPHQVTLISIADSTILQGYPDFNAGGTSDMWAGYDDYLDPDGEIVRGLVRFDLSGLPPGAQINSATLRLYLIASWDYPNCSRTITTHRIGSDWAEMTVTWNNKPSCLEAYGSNSVQEGAWGWYDFDVTALVQAWANGSQPNYGIMIRGPEHSGPDSSWRGFSTREGPHPPQLVINYIGSAASAVLTSTATPTTPSKSILSTVGTARRDHRPWWGDSRRLEMLTH